MNKPKIIVLGLSPTGKYIAKEAAKFKIECLGFDFKVGAGYYSKYFEKVEVLPMIAFLDRLNEIYLNNGMDYFFCPTSDEWIEFINENKSLFINSNLKTSSSYLDSSYDLLANKFKLIEVAEKAELNYPKSLLFQPENALKPVLQDFDFPIFVKPSSRAGLAELMQGKKGWLFNTKSEWAAFDELNCLKGIELLIQEVIVGPESNIKVLATVAHEGKFFQTWTGIKLRQYPHGFGSGSCVIEDQNDVELRTISEKLIESVKYSGYFALETKFCEKRRKTFIIEVNTRPGLWFGATTTASIYLVNEWYQSLSGSTLENDIARKYSNKPTVWRYFYKDLYVKLRYRNSNKKDFPNSYVSSYAVFDTKDIKPFIYDLFAGFSKMLKRRAQ